jgi:hypothetical protein
VMRDRFPGSPESAVKAIERFYQDLDDRFDVKVTASSTARHLDIKARAPATVSLSLGGISPEAQAAMRHALDWGKTFKIADVEVSATGSRLLEKLCQEKRTTLELGSSFQLSGIFNLATRGGGRANLLLPATLTAGPRGVAVETAAVDCPLHVELLLKWSAPTDTHITGNVQVSVKPAEWIGRDLLTAPHRVPLCKFLESVSRGNAVTLRYDSGDGRMNIEVPSGAVNFGALIPHREWFHILADTACVAQHFGLTPTIPDPAYITEKHLADLGVGLDAVRSQRIQRPSVNVFHRDPDAETQALFADLSTVGSLIGTIEATFPFHVELFETQREVGVVEIIRTRCRITPAASQPGYTEAFTVCSLTNKPLDLHVRLPGGKPVRSRLPVGEFRFFRDRG